MACPLPHTFDEIQALVTKFIDEDIIRQKALMELAVQFENASAAKSDFRKFVKDHPRFLKNPFIYVTGILLLGIVIPMISAARYMKSTKNACNGEYAEANDSNLLCMSRIDEVNKPDYYYATIWANDKKVMKALDVRKGRVDEQFLCNMDMKYHYGYTKLPLYEFNCYPEVDIFTLSGPRHVAGDTYPGRHVARDILKGKARRGRILSRATFYERTWWEPHGDHDMTVPHLGTLKWIQSLDLTITESDWDVWYSDDQVAGYKTTEEVTQFHSTSPNNALTW
ncbi:peptidase S10, serine carboxypeptidase, alpha/beta hydrolase fold protein [Tanacetum coccineum]